MKPGNHIRILKAADPDSKRLWREIESGILIDGLYGEVNRVVLESAIRNLPEIKPDRDIWLKLHQHINIGHNASRHRIFNNYLLRIAATVVFLISTWLVVDKLILPDPANLRNGLQEDSIDSFLTQLCATYPKKCREEDFIELKSEIIRLNNEKSEVENSIFYNPADVSITKINDRINSQIASLKSQIIDYVE